MTTLLGVDLVGRPVLVAGGGRVAAVKAAALVEDGALVHVVAPFICEDMVDLVDGIAVTWSQREVDVEDVAGVWFVVAATGDRPVDQALCARATADRIFSVCAGAAEHGTARNPAVTDHAGLRVGVVSNGRPDPSRVVGVRDALALHLETADLDLRARRTAPGAKGRVILVGGGPGAEDLITVRGRQAIAEADVVVTDRLGPTTLLRRLPADVEVIDVGKTAGHHPVPQHEINRILVEQAQRGRRVVRLKGGDPFVYGRGGEEVIACREAGVDIDLIPGVSSALSAPGAAGIPLTHRGTVGALHVVHGHEPIDPHALAGVADEKATLVILMGVRLLADHVRDLVDAGAGADLPVAIVEAATTPRQRVTTGSLSSIVTLARGASVRAPAVIVVGRVADPTLLARG
ncbi:multifunctional uroporphyrinogen III methylase/precorrin-2 oxidase/ferrochelatase [Knoellia sinensis KCTC 19936]|uniref:Multifunctional uroporphyrinogen III methylase/precorrin-2 oxidase/ferrochelatase n=1 Tax=Knoellia sinensis KCTC 19936 TaxID=1385520 RepID=A0A0A0JFG0_9MICO|nr:uroporphyrinogen-III C-methyltransferase [Knoellia sinensis]KGN34807.1 multifunctional uroporphyrinogen III methylase/precorrin-2 oxidase/ferrochelatase [Knoellia sinensis KCTC 19936]